MEISVDKNNSQILLSLTGRLDNLTAASLQHAVDVNVSDYSTGANVCIDFSSVDFVSSAGLRVLLLSMKKLKSGNGSLEIKNINDSIKEVFEITGFSNIFKIS